MEFELNLNNLIFDELIIKINSDLLPEHFSGDRRSASQCATVIRDLLDDLGIASAKAQDLVKPITSGDKLRNSNHIVYLLLEQTNEKIYVVGLLKVGEKNLYVYDENGHVHEKAALCILDFYILESRQRMGHGKILYDYMLQDMKILPEHLAIDKPSRKFISFLHKHYGLEKIIPQSNNFVLFDGFFEQGNEENSMNIKTSEKNGGVPNTHSTTSHSNEAELCNNEYEFPKYGRHAAYKRIDTMAQILDRTYTQATNRNGE